MQAARAEELEAENAKLVAELQFAQTDRNGSPDARCDKRREVGMVDVVEYERVKDLLAKSDEDYGKVVFARQLLESKLRHYKSMTKQWRDYTEKWRLRYPRKQLKSMDPSRTSPVVSVRDPRSSSAPAPPSIPDDMTPSVDFRSLSPWAIADDVQQQRRTPALDFNRPSKVPSDRVLISQKTLHNDLRASSGDLTEASDVSISRSEDCSKAFSNRTIEGSNLDLEQNAKEAGSSPVIVSERSLKRKNPVYVRKEIGRPKPLVKTEQASSSPLPALTTVAINGPHDSLDLDDIDGHVDTPRKRRQLEQIRLESSKMASAANQENLSASKYATGTCCDEVYVIKDEDSKIVMTNDQQLLYHSSKRAENLEKQNNEQHKQPARKARSRAQQQAHNRTIHERLEVAEQSPITKTTHPRRSIRTYSRKDSLSIPTTTPPQDIYPTPTTEKSEHYHAPRSCRETEQRRAEIASPAILQPTDPNIPMLPRTSSKLTKHKASSRSHRRDHGAAHVSALAEDGEDSPSLSKKSKGKHFDPTIIIDKSVKVPDAHQRLGTLLNEPLPAKWALMPNIDSIKSYKEPVLSKTPINRANYSADSKTFTTPHEKPSRTSILEAEPERKTSTEQPGSAHTPANQVRELAQEIINKTTSTSLSHKATSKAPPTDDQPENEPLRARPLHRLRLDDFKLNPTHGDFAYHESIRKHDEKHSTSGCTDRTCPRCKDLRKFVENSAYARTPPGQDISLIDQRLLEDYLGVDGNNNKHQIVEKLSSTEKAELLLQAKTKQFVDKFGKHRTAFARAQSPVDFWNTDFPSTQEHERNREAARVREREKVVEMYYEAIRQGGRYVFVDE